MNVGSVFLRSATRSPTSNRTLVFDFEQSRQTTEHTVSCDCGFSVTSEQSREEHAALLIGAGWTSANDRLRCPECSAGVIRRVIIGSAGDPYDVHYFGDTWRCSCPGYTYRKRCWHADSLNRETKEKERLVTLANDFLNNAAPGATVFPADFLLWLGDDAPDATVEESRAVLAAVLEGYRRVCAACNGEGGEVHVIGGWDEPICESHRCSHCEGEGALEPLRLAPIEAAMPIAAE